MDALWHRGVSLLVFTILAILPVTGTVCAALCVPTENAAAATDTDHHHAPAKACHEPVSGQPELRGTSSHNCMPHEGAAREAVASLTAVRADIGVRSVGHHVSPRAPSLIETTSVRIHSGSSPPGTVSLTRAPLVLRI